MFYLIYVSSAVTKFSQEELLGLLAQCHEHNGKVGITGMLLYKDGNFMQALEGDEVGVRALYAKIGRDPRHRGLITLLQGSLAERQFAGWSMGFNDLNRADVRSAPGYDEFMDTPLVGEEFSTDITRCQRLLTIFKRNMS